MTKAALATLLVLDAILVLTVASFIIAPELEPVLFPISIVSVESSSRNDDGSVSLYFTSTKNRDCLILASRSYIAPMDKPLNRTPIVMINEFNAPAGTVTRPTGYNVTGPFKFMLPKVGGFDGPLLLTTVGDYNCHPGWLTEENFGPFVIP